MYPHRIRLRGPWDCQPLARSSPGNLPPPFRMTMPCRWADRGLPGFSGQVRFLRRFGLPSRIDAHERVWLTFAGFADRAEIALNGQSLGRHEGSAAPLEFEVTPWLGSRNELQVIVEGSAESAGLTDEVALEVRCSAYLRSVRVSLGGARLSVEGAVVGTADRQLELYLLLGRFTVGYFVVEADPQGRTFHFTSEELEPERLEQSALARVELVNAASVWYECEVPIEGRAVVS